MKKYIPLYITDKKNCFKILIFIFLFAVTFLIIYPPFDSTIWFPKEKGSILYFVFLLLPALFGMIILSFSRYLMYKHSLKKKINFYKFGFWILVEILFISIIYTCLNHYFFQDPRKFLIIFGKAVFNISIMELIPYAISILFISYLESRNVIESLKNDNIENHENDLINFTDDKGTERLSIRLDNILYLESADNYITVHYLSKETVSVFMFRNSLNSIEATFKGRGLVRCHRSFIINIHKVVVLRKARGGFFLELDNENVPNIPVSKTYCEQIIELFSKE
ncbi:MAG: LytTR family transcriptional regulator [Bacteroidales bacterium]|jgi:hypothetical protein|nr:LytTR family transcriptional regulator [Bacteroidales bacterium]